jgi:hypothetical protein
MIIIIILIIIIIIIIIIDSAVCCINYCVINLLYGIWITFFLYFCVLAY